MVYLLIMLIFHGKLLVITRWYLSLSDVDQCEIKPNEMVADSNVAGQVWENINHPSQPQSTTVYPNLQI